MPSAFRDVPIANNVAYMGPVQSRRLYSAYRILADIHAGKLSPAQMHVESRMAMTALRDLFPFIKELEVDNG